VPVELRELAIASFVQVENPLPEVADRFKALVGQGGEEGLASTALLALGTVTMRWRGLGNEEAAGLAGFIVEQAGANQDDSWTRTSLAALENAGHPLAAEFILAQSRVEDESTRGRALLALKRLEGAEVEGRLWEALEKDPSADVRIAAIRAMEFKDATPFDDAVRKALQQDSDESVRTAAISYFARRILEDEGARTLVQNAAAQDTAESVRKFASEALGNP
jgi:hypothetical protein